MALETSGASAAITTGLQTLRPWGSICLVGLGGEVRFHVEDHFRSQITLMTSWTLSIVAQRRCAEFIATRDLPVDDIFTHRWELDDVVEAYANFDRQAGGKGVILFEEDN